VTKIEETRLPGVGVRHDFTTSAGDRIGVLAHRSGDRELLIYDRRDPDTCSRTVRLDEHDSRTLTELLGGDEVTERVATLPQSVEGLTIDWLQVRRGSAFEGVTIEDTRLRQQTGVSVVAVVREERTYAAPGPELRLEAGDVVVVVGTGEGIQRALEVIQAPG
jgi:TrkA domain protein